MQGRSECMQVQCSFCGVRVAGRVIPPATAAALDRCRSEKFKILVIGKRFHLKPLLWILIGGEQKIPPP